MANKYEDYIENNSVTINKRLETLSLEINEKEKAIKKLEEKE
jgi:hypothetical protein